MLRVSGAFSGKLSKIISSTVFSGVLCVLLVLNAITAGIANASPLTDSITAFTAQKKPLVQKSMWIEPTSIAPMYSLAPGRLFWIQEQGTTAVASRNLAYARALFQTATLRGLNISDYWSDTLELLARNAASGTLAAADAAIFELAVTQSLVRFAQDVSHGRVDPSEVDDETDLVRLDFTEHAALVAAIGNSNLDARNLDATIAALEPNHEHYRGLKDLLKTMLEAKRDDGFKPIKMKKTVRPGEKSDTVVLIRKRLFDLGYLAADLNNDSPIYDEAMVAAAKEFQLRHVLEADGLLGTQVFAALNTPFSARIAQVRANMERWRWMPRDLGEKYLFVNTAFQDLRAIESKREVLKMRVVNGKGIRRTPTMVDKVSRIILNPYWSAPPSIAAKDLIPKLKKDPTIATTMGYRIIDANKPNVTDGSNEINARTVNWAQFGIQRVPFLFRQEPGPQNSLGQIKFDLTNKRAIYLHHTPHREDFAKTVRQLSSGCIRVQDPMALALYILQEKPEWTAEKIRRVWGVPQQIKAMEIDIEHEPTIYIGFFTVIPNDEGRARFAPDSYGQDERIVNLMSPGTVRAGRMEF